MPAVNLQIPLLFDISAGGIVFGETTSDTDLFDAHLNFQVAGSSGTALVNEFKKIMYADPSENDVSGVLFYSTTAGLSSTLGGQISAAILGSSATLIQPSATSSADASGNTGASHGARYMTPGIPLPNYSCTVAADRATAHASRPTTNEANQKYYTDALVDAGGTSFGRVLIRLMATHLMGHPFAQAFIANESSIITDISNSDITSQLENRLLKNDSTMFSDGASNSVTAATVDGARYKADKADGIRNQILQSIYEALLGTAPERFDLSANDVGYDVSGADISGGTDFDGGNLDPTECRPRALPFESGDSISFYFRPRVRLNIDTAVGGAGAEYGNQDLSGVGQGGSGTSNAAIRDIFFNPRHRWIAHHDSTSVKHSTETSPADTFNATNGYAFDTYDDETATMNALTMTGTDLVIGATHGSETIGANDGTMFDGHVWKIKVVMP